MAADYPTLSDYCYVAGNPLFFVDSDGREIRVYNETEDDYVVYKNGEYLNSDYTKFEGILSQYQTDTKTSLDFISNSETGKNIIDNIANASSDEFTINMKNAGKNDALFVMVEGNEGNIFTNSRRVTPDAINQSKRIPAITYIHELDHANFVLNAFRAIKNINGLLGINTTEVTLKDVHFANKLNRQPPINGNGTLDSAEEERVILGNEAKIIKELKKIFPTMQGLELRESHWGGDSYYSSGPLSID